MNKYCFWCGEDNDNNSSSLCSKCDCAFIQDTVTSCMECSVCKEGFRPRNMKKINGEYVCRECFENKGVKV